MANGKVLRSRGVGNIKLSINNSDPIKVSVLVMDSALLGFDLLLGMDIIKELGQHLADFGLKCKKPEQLEDSAHVLSLQVSGTIVENTFWLCPKKDTQQINLS